MLYRAIVIGIDNDFSYVLVKDPGNWIDFQGRSYRKVQEYNLQVVDRYGQITDVVEAIYFEGRAAPINSELSEDEIIKEEKELTKQVFQEVSGRVYANPQVSFWNKIFNRGN